MEYERVVKKICHEFPDASASEKLSNGKLIEMRKTSKWKQCSIQHQRTVRNVGAIGEGAVKHKSQETKKINYVGENVGLCFVVVVSFITFWAWFL